MDERNAGKTPSKSKTEAPAVEQYETVTVSLDVLEKTPARALQLLTGINRSLPIRAAAERVGCTAAVRAEGWRRIQALAGIELTSEAASRKSMDAPVSEAIVALDRSDEKLLAKIEASLAHAFPAEAKRVLQGLSGKTGAEAVIVVSTVLQRLTALESSASGRAALERLAERGLGPDERARLDKLVRLAGEGSSTPVGTAPSATKAQSADEYLRSLRAVRAWYEEWSGLLRTEIDRRDWLILLGLAARKRVKRTEAPSA
ncbi:MAG: hypothetical protein Q8Q09_06560 [Deltaproteobacteria bacterium]|nr:hypothetical protein [Deltaproteobacteria bacterium]